MVVGKQFGGKAEKLLDNPIMFRRLIEGFQYVTNSRPEISYPVNKLSRHLNQPTVKQWQAAKRILWYLQGTLNFDLHYKPSPILNLQSYCDADWAVAHEESPYQDIVFIWGIHWLHGHQRDRTWCHDLLLSRSTEQ